MKFHPDKNKTPEAEEMFKKISEAYQVLSDPILRKKYNEFGPGKGSDPEGGFINPEEFFKMQFGGELFVDIIGELQIAKEFKNMMMKNGAEGVEGEEEEKEDLSVTLEKRREELEVKKKVREERVILLAEKLVKKLNVYIESGPDNFRKFIADEAEELKVQSYGVQLLHSIGYIYSVKASEYISKYNDDIFSTPSFVHRMRLKGRTFTETFNTVKSAVDVHHSFVQLQEAEKTGATDAEKEKLTEDAVKKGTDAIWKTSKLEVESVIRSVCDKACTDISVDKITLRKRAEALKIVGDSYQSVTPPLMPTNIF
ncbi:putative J domain-containing protein C3E7.11c [Orchesella cincta]|uniref:Putative J domain-containing protein C3E7.11c n=1 Tax=Orchesella cincta TaxID=48709 RepID=A0A1D2N8Y7_ORCCI|nr:putative J domain-containing protein C3E7.11c [Orchesella cincta]